MIPSPQPGVLPLLEDELLDEVDDALVVLLLAAPPPPPPPPPEPVDVCFEEHPVAATEAATIARITLPFDIMPAGYYGHPRAARA